METSFVLGKLADVELKLEMIAEKAAERVNNNHVERSRLGRPCFDHTLELKAAVVGGGCARLHIGFDELVAARCAIRFALSALVGDGDIMLGLPRRRDAQVKGGALRRGHDGNLLTSSAWPE